MAWLKQTFKSPPSQELQIIRRRIDRDTIDKPAFSEGSSITFNHSLQQVVKRRIERRQQRLQRLYLKTLFE